MTGIMTDIQFYSNIVVGTAVFISSATVIIQAFTKYNPLIGVRTWFNQPVTKQINELDIKNTNEHNGLITLVNEHTKQLEEIGIDKLKSDICNSDIPLVERVNSADRYLAKGLNGEIKIIGKILKEQLENDLKSKGGKK